MNILFKYPSRQRPEKFFRGLNNIQRMVANADSYLILISLDEDDPTMNNEKVKRRLSLYDHVMICWGKSENKIHAVNRDMEFISVWIWDIIIIMSDDMLFCREGFDDVIRKYMLHYFPDLDGVLHFPDSYAKMEKIVLSVIGRTYFERFQYLYFPDYKTMFADDEFTEVAHMLNRYAFCPTKIFDHHHHLNGKAEKDALYERNDNLNLFVPDNQLYVKRKQNYFGLTISNEVLWK